MSSDVRTLFNHYQVCSTGVSDIRTLLSRYQVHSTGLVVSNVRTVFSHYQLCSIGRCCSLWCLSGLPVGHKPEASVRYRLFIRWAIIKYTNLQDKD